MKQKPEKPNNRKTESEITQDGGKRSHARHEEELRANHDETRKHHEAKPPHEEDAGYSLQAAGANRNGKGRSRKEKSGYRGVLE